MISLVIITFNQQEQLAKSLPMWLAQENAAFEICVVDKNSEDDTIHMLEDMEERHSNLRHTAIPRTARIDKDRLAVMLGIRGAVWNRIIILRPHVIPPATGWLRHIADTWNTQRPILLIPVIQGRKLTFRQRYALFMAKHGRARWALGHAIGYSKDFFMNSGGFPGKTNLSTFNALVRYYSKPNNTQIIKDAKHTLHSLVS